MKVRVLPIHSSPPVVSRYQELSLQANMPFRTRDEAVEAFDAFYAAWSKRVLAWLRALGVRPSELDDVTQEVFLKVYRLLPGFDGKSPAAWLYRIATNVARNHRRSGWLRRLIFHADLQLEPGLIDERTTQEAREAKERLDELYAMLDRLEPKRRAALWMFEVEEMSGEEIAEVEGIPVNTVWSRLRLARKDFSKLVQSAKRAGKEPRWP